MDTTKISNIPTAAEARKEFLKLFKQLCYSRSNWQVWADLMSVFACSIANSVEINEDRRAAREAEYEKAIARLGGNEIPAEMFVLYSIAVERKPEQDFLGSVFEELRLSNHWKGQFFTPYNICELMAQITLDIPTDKPWFSVCDCACGAGATLIAAANIMKRQNVNYQTKAIFVGQDIDRIAAMMCYIQLAMMGCAGYVCVADSLTNPMVGDALIPAEQPGQEFFYTPMYYRDCWEIRKLANSLSCLFAG